MQESEAAPVKTADFPASEAEQAAAAKARRSALLSVFLVMFIDLLGFGIVLPLLPRYGKDFLVPLFPDASQAGLRGIILGLLMASFSAMQFVFAPIWGRMSDRMGRRPFLLLGLAGSVLFYALFGFASDWPPQEGRRALGLALMFLARMGAGIAGATVSTAQAVIADCTTPEKRSHGMALIGAAFGIGFTFGPVLGAGAVTFFPHQPAGPGFVASGCSLIALVLCVWLMPETLRAGAEARHRAWFNWRGLQTALRVPTVGLLILTFFLSTLAFACFEPTLALLTKDILHYGEDKNFLVFAYVGFVLMLTQGVLYRRLARRGVKEVSFMLIGGLLMIMGLGGIGIIAAYVAPAPDGIHGGWPLLLSFLAAVTISVMGFAFVTPSVQALISRRSDPAKQGEILGVNQSANALSRILGPMAGMSLYNLQTSHALPYIFSVSLLTGMLLLTLREKRT